MAVFAKRGEGKVYPETGTYEAMLYKVVDLGKQKSDYQGVVSENYKIACLFELNERYPDGDAKDKRIIKAKEYNNTLYFNAKTGKKSALLTDIEKLTGRAFTESELKKADEIDIEKLLTGVFCNVEINEKGYIKGVTKPLKSQKPFKIEVSNDYIPKFLQDKILNQIKEGGVILNTFSDGSPVPKDEDAPDDFYKNTGFDEKPVNPNIGDTYY